MVTIFLVIMRVMRSRLGPLPDGAILGEKRITLSDEGIRRQGRYTDWFIQWPAVLDLIETRDHFFVMIDRTAGIIVPKRCFASELECHEFAEALRLHASGTLK
jgi:hypothetical protein